MKEEDVVAIFQREFNKNYFAGNTRVPPHTHNGIDNLKISAANITGFLNGSGFSTFQVFSSSGTFITNGTSLAYVQIVGGGGSSAACSGSGGTPSGGSGAGYSAGFVDLSSTTSVSVTIGAGGIAPPSGTNNGNPGGNTTFGSFMTATGGLGGLLSGAVVPGQGATGGDLNINGGDSGHGYSIFVSSITNTGISGCGGSSFFGSGPGPVFSTPTSSNPGTDATIPGTGASGPSASSGSVSSQPGAKGADGIAIIMF